MTRFVWGTHNCCCSCVVTGLAVLKVVTAVVVPVVFYNMTRFIWGLTTVVSVFSNMTRFILTTVVVPVVFIQHDSFYMGYSQLLLFLSSLYNMTRFIWGLTTVVVPVPLNWGTSPPVVFIV